MPTARSATTPRRSTAPATAAVLLNKKEVATAHSVGRYLLQVPPHLRRGLKGFTHTLRRTAAAFALLCAPTILSRADIIQGKVIGITDGDTITILDALQSSHRIWLQGIDAPES